MSVRDAAERWLAQDPDPQTRDELAALLARDDAGDPDARAELDDRFDGALTFGTAGLRGRLGAGTNRMNRVVVAYAAAGLGAYLVGRAEGGASPTVVIGYDGRRGSLVFARDSAEVLAGAGLRPLLLPTVTPTPVLAFAVRHFGADAGVMVTASHNPRDDNGYKIYLGGSDGGAQVVAPADAAIAAEIDRITATIPAGAIPRSVGYRTVGDEVVRAYVAATAAVATAEPGAEGLRWVYSAMHGVGWETTRAVLAAAEYPEPELVTEQAAPDPTFPTVPFPNPEEDGALDLAFATARESDAELVLAHDPDADRLAVAIPDDAVEGGWRRLSGNDVGLLLAWRAARHAREVGAPAGASLASTLVSSPALAAVAEHYGLDVHTTLTGFKWIARAPGLVFGYEEALGYLVNPETLLDKDGISAALAVLSLAAHARRRGESLTDLLAEFHGLFGHHGSDQFSIRVDDAGVIDRIMSSLRADPPARVGETKVKRFDDLLSGHGDLPPGDVVRLTLKGGGRVLVRPSGTEPKLKVYVDVRGDSADEARGRLDALATAARALIEQRS